MFAKSGYGPNKPLTLTLTYHNKDEQKKIALAVQAMWENVLGITVNLQALEWKAFLQTRREGSLQISQDDWFADFPIVRTYLDIFSCSNIDNAPHFCNQSYENLLKQASITLDQQQQIALYKQALLLLNNSYVIAPLVQASSVILIKPYVKGYNPQDNHFGYVKSQWMRLEN